MKRRLVLSAFTAAFLAADVGRAQGISAQDLARARAEMSSRPTVSTIAPGCVKPSWGASITVNGLNFGAAQGGRSVVFTLGGRRLDSRVTSWSNGRIVVSVSPFAALSPAEAAPISFEVRNEAGQAYPDTVRQLHACRTRFEQTIAFDLGVCSCAASALRFVAQRSPEPGEYVSAAAAGPGRYQARTAFVEGSWRLNPDRIPECPDGHWEPSVPSMVVDDAHWQQTFLFRYVTPTRRVTVPASTITTFVKTALADTAIHLNNYGPKVGKSYLKRGDAWVKFGSLAGGGTFPIAIEEIRLDPPDPLGRILYYVKDVKSTGVTFRHDAAHYHLGVAFANDAEAIKGEHEGAGISPSMALSDAKVAVALHFAAGAGPKPDVVVDSVTFTARIDGGCNVAIFNVCSLVYGILKNGLPERGVPGLEQRVKDALSDPGTRAAIGDAIWNGLDSPVGRAVITNAAGGAKVSRLLRVSAASADGLEVEFVPSP